MIEVQSTAVGRSNEHTEMLLQAKPESSTTDQSTLPTQASKETRSTTSEGPEDYWNRDRWTEEEEEEEDIKEDIMDMEEGELWPSYPDYTPDTSLGDNHQLMLQGNNSLLSTGFKFSCPIIPMIPCVPGDSTLLCYELRTNTLDPWGYDSINTITIHQHHSLDHITQIQVSPVHIYGTTHCLSTSSTYEGFHDNHPLQDWNNEIMDIDMLSFKPWSSEEERQIGGQLMLADLAVEAEMVTLEDWSHYPNSEEYTSVRERILTATDHYYLTEIDHTYHIIVNPNLDSNTGKAGNHSQDVGDIIQTQTQNPKIIQYVIQEIKEFLNEDYTGSDHLSMYESKREEELPTLFLPSPNDYKDIGHNDNSLIKYNAWHPCIAYLRCIHLHITNAIRLIAKCMFKPLIQL
jgi:hypothetical protein